MSEVRLYRGAAADRSSRLVGVEARRQDVAPGLLVHTCLSRLAAHHLTGGGFNAPVGERSGYTILTTLRMHPDHITDHITDHNTDHIRV